MFKSQIKKNKITRSQLEKKYLFKQYLNGALQNVDVLNKLYVDSASKNLTTLSKVDLVTGLVKSFNQDYDLLHSRLNQIKINLGSVDLSDNWFKIVYFLPGSKIKDKNVFIFEGRCLQIRNNGLHTKLILENSLKIVQQFCIHATNVLQISLHTHQRVETLYTHPSYSGLKTK
jgi:ribosomal protein L19